MFSFMRFNIDYSLNSTKDGQDKHFLLWLSNIMKFFNGVYVTCLFYEARLIKRGSIYGNSEISTR